MYYDLVFYEGKALPSVAFVALILPFEGREGRGRQGLCLRCAFQKRPLRSTSERPLGEGDHIPLVSPVSLTILFRIVWEFSTQLKSLFCPVFLPARPSSTRRAMSAGACFLL